MTDLPFVWCTQTQQQVKLKAAILAHADGLLKGEVLCCQVQDQCQFYENRAFNRCWVNRQITLSDRDMQIVEARP